MVHIQKVSLQAILFVGLVAPACANNRFKPSTNQVAREEPASAEADQVPETDPSPPSAEPAISPMAPTPATQLPTVITGTTDEQRIQSFAYGEPNPKVDYVFVLDNSSSMSAILQKVQLGFASLVANNNVFSPDSQIAVMSTMIGDPNNFAMTGTGVVKYTGIDLEPGFLDFVDKISIVNYKTNVPKQADHWPILGCAKKWFAPGDKDEAGNFCFTGATQSTNSSLDAEAGIHAFGQLFQKFKGKAIFRPGSRVNVIFVSDTHDPGNNSDALAATTPSYADLVKAALVDNKINALTFHAIAPQISGSCSQETFKATSYYKIVDDSKGEKTDICTLTDYAAFLSRMIAKSKATEPLFQLTLPASKILQVLVDGNPTSNYEITGPKKDVLRINGLDPLKAVQVRVVFEPTK